MVKIALDPHLYHSELSVADELRKAADLGYSYLELSSRADWFYWQRYPKADDAIIAETRKAVAETGVEILALLPVFDWSSPREKVRRAQVRNWRRLLQIAHDLECPVVNSELAGDSHQPLRSENAFYQSMEELIPDFERYGIGLNLEAHPDDFSETLEDSVRIVRGINRPWANYAFSAPAAGQGVRRILTYASPKLAHVHITDCVTEEDGSGGMNWSEFFGALRDLRFAGTATVCVYGEEDNADGIHRRMLQRVSQELT